MYIQDLSINNQNRSVMKKTLLILLCFLLVFISCYRDDISNYKNQDIDFANSDTVSIDRIKIKTH